MAFALIFTSVPQGLKPGTGGFCTVAQTQGLPERDAKFLESLSGYQDIAPATSPQALSLNPIAYSHWCFDGGTRQVLSRVAFAGLDYSGRSNKLAHHLLLTPDDGLPNAGPAALLLGLEDAGLLAADSNDAKRRRGWHPPLRLPAVIANDANVSANRWGALTGDPGWAGVLAEAFLAGRKAFLVFAPGGETNGPTLLRLFAEALALLPSERRWDVTFTTYFMELHQGSDCHWRAVPAGSPHLNQATRLDALILDLTALPFPRQAQGGGLVEAARTGIMPLRRQPAAPASIAEAAPALEPMVAADVGEANAEATPKRIMLSGHKLVTTGQHKPNRRIAPAPKRRGKSLFVTVAGAILLFVLLAIVVLMVIPMGTENISRWHRLLNKLPVSTGQKKTNFDGAKNERTGRDTSASQHTARVSTIGDTISETKSGQQTTATSSTAPAAATRENQRTQPTLTATTEKKTLFCGLDFDKENSLRIPPYIDLTNYSMQIIIIDNARGQNEYSPKNWVTKSGNKKNKFTSNGVAVFPDIRKIYAKEPTVTYLDDGEFLSCKIQKEKIKIITKDCSQRKINEKINNINELVYCVILKTQNQHILFHKNIAVIKPTITCKAISSDNDGVIFSFKTNQNYWFKLADACIKIETIDSNIQLSIGSIDNNFFYGTAKLKNKSKEIMKIYKKHKDSEEKYTSDSSKAKNEWLKKTSDATNSNDKNTAKKEHKERVTAIDEEYKNNITDEQKGLMTFLFPGKSEVRVSLLIDGQEAAFCKITP